MGALPIFGLVEALSPPIAGAVCGLIVCERETERDGGRGGRREETGRPFVVYAS